MPGMAFSSLHKADLCYAERKTQEADETELQSILTERGQQRMEGWTQQERRGRCQLQVDIMELERSRNHGNSKTEEGLRKADMHQTGAHTRSRPPPTQPSL